MSTSQKSEPPFHIAIIGAGFGGLALGAKLKAAGINDFVILERASSAGGVWRENTYPGAACDIPSRLYSLSSAPSAAWSRRYPSQPEIKTYAQSLPQRLALEPHIRYSISANQMQWDNSSALWQIDTNTGRINARFLVTANGGLETPNLLTLAGLEQFSGVTAHTAKWPDQLNLKGKRVALVGTGASAIQAGPAIAQLAAQLDIYQRTAPWVIPRFDRQISTPMKWALSRLPFVAQTLRAMVYALHELRVLAFMNRKVMTLGQSLIKAWVSYQVTDPELRAKVLPSITLGCKRILISDDWYPALLRPNVKLIANEVTAANQGGLVDSSGAQRPYDVIVFATGFHVTDNPFTQTVKGLNGTSLSQVINGEGLYLGMTSSHLPNFFAMAGNNTATGHNSQIFMLECMANYICLGIKASSGSILRLKPNIAAPFNVWVQERLKNSVWRAGCKSWYQNAQGKVLVIWPGFTWRFWQRTRRFDKALYEEPL
jgi:cation diffusion facilitator CzcD-associated flavoprotein CzcO